MNLSEQLESLDSLEKAATPGPATLQPACFNKRGGGVYKEPITTPSGTVAVTFNRVTGSRLAAFVTPEPSVEGRLYVALRNAAPELIAAVRAAAVVSKDDSLNVRECLRKSANLEAALTALSAALAKTETKENR